jgi:hypothetical protein
MQNFNQNFSNFDKQLKFSQLVVSEIASYLNKKGFVAIIKWGKVGYDLVVGFPDKTGKLIKCWKKIEIKHNLKCLNVGYFQIELRAILNAVRLINGERDFDYTREIWFVGFYKDHNQDFYLVIFRNLVSNFNRLMWKLFECFYGGDKPDYLLKIPLCWLNFSGILKIQKPELLSALRELENDFDFSVLNLGFDYAEIIKENWFIRFGLFVQVEFAKLSPLFESPNPEISEKLKF